MQDDLIDITWFEEMFPPVKPDHDDKLDDFCYAIGGRGNGKSFRQLREMMKAFDEGKHVVIMPYHQGYSYMKSFIDELYDNIQKYEIDILKKKERQIMGVSTEEIYKGGLYIKKTDGTFSHYEKLCDVTDVTVSTNSDDSADLHVDGKLVFEKKEEVKPVSNKYCFANTAINGVLYNIDIVKEREGSYCYHARIYKIISGFKRDYLFTFGYDEWEQLETQLLLDLYKTAKIDFNYGNQKSIARELLLARGQFRGCEPESLHGGYTHTITPEIMEFKNGNELTLRKAKPFEVMPKIEKVIFNPPATIVQWKDGTKTVVKCQDGDEFDWEKGLAMAYVKRAYGNERSYYGLFQKNEPFMNLPNSNVKYDPKVAKEVRIIVPKDLPVTKETINDAFDLITSRGRALLSNGVEVEQD